MKRGVLVGAFIVGVFVAHTSFAASSTSTNFINSDSTFVPATFSAQSSNFQINGSIEPTVGAGTSPGFSVQSGVPLPQPPAASVTPPAGGSGTGGGGLSQSGSTGYVTPPTLTFRSPTFLSHQLLKGTRGSKETAISVNGSTNGVTYLTDLSWQRDLPLFLGKNAVQVQGKIPSGYTTPMIGGEIERLLIGDVNRDHVVNDRDLSLFVRAWKIFTPYADFNEDRKINDADLSLLVSHWNQTY